jgi:LysM repeat protein
MSDYFDDDAEFWGGQGSAGDRTSQINRVHRRSPERTRSHGIVRRDVPVEEHDEAAEMWIESPTQGIVARLGPLGAVDPRVLSIGAVVIAVVLAVPLFSALGDSGSSDDLRAINEQSTTTAVPTVTPTTAPADVVVVTAARDGSGVVGGNGSDVSTGTADDDAVSAVEAAPAEAQALESDPDCANQYTAAAGDYWLRIAEGADSPLDSLLDVNEATAETPIYPGSTICLPDGAAAPAGFATGAGDVAIQAAVVDQCANVYESVAGDYWLRIADAAGLGLDELLELNDATADTPLYPGSEVCLPAGASGPSAPTTEPQTTAPPTTAAPTTAAPTTAPATTEAPATTAAPATTEASATTEATTVPPAPPAPGEIEQIIRDVWPDDLEEQALRIAWRESGYNPYAQSYCCSGLFQIYYDVHAIWLADLGINSASDLYDPRLNAEAAYTLYQRSGGWSPWPTTAD